MQNDEDDNTKDFMCYFEAVVEECGLASYKKSYTYEEIFWQNENEPRQSHLKPLNFEQTEPYDYEKDDSNSDEVVLNIERLLRLIALIALAVVVVTPAVKWVTQLSSEELYELSESELIRILAVIAFFFGVNAKSFVVFVVDFTDSLVLTYSLHTQRNRIKKSARSGGKHLRHAKRRKKAIKVYPPFQDDVS